MSHHHCAHLRQQNCWLQGLDNFYGFFASTTGFPLILKPRNLYNSLFVSLSFSQEELLRNYERMLETLPSFFQKAKRPHEGGQIQAEEFLAGSIHTIDCVVDAAGNISPTPIMDTLTGREIGEDDFHHFTRYTPSQLPAHEQEQFYRLAIVGVQALDITSSLAHVEVIRAAHGPKLLEIGARPGGSRPRFLDLSYGIDLIYNYYQVRLGNKADVTPQWKRPLASVTPYPKQQGVLRGIDLERIKKLRTYAYHEVKVDEGQAVGSPQQGYLAPLNIELMSSHMEDILRDMQEIQSWQDLYSVA